MGNVFGVSRHIDPLQGYSALPDCGGPSAAAAIAQFLITQIALYKRRRLKSAVCSSRLRAVEPLGLFDFAY